jgi:protein SCO1/2
MMVPMAPLFVLAAPARRRTRSLGRLAVLAAALAIAAAVAGCGGSSSDRVAFSGTPVPGTPQAPDFTLVDQSGTHVALSQQRGRLVLLTFLYTHCPDVCPLIAQNLNTVLRNLPAADAARVRVLAVSVDPAGDTPQAVRSFVQRHRLLPAFRYLTGSRSELEQIWGDYRVAAQPISSGLSAHTAATYLIGADGREQLLYTSLATPAAIERDVRTMLAGS